MSFAPRVRAVPFGVPPAETTTTLRPVSAEPVRFLRPPVRLEGAQGTQWALGRKIANGSLVCRLKASKVVDTRLAGLRSLLLLEDVVHRASVVQRRLRDSLALNQLRDGAALIQLPWRLSQPVREQGLARAKPHPAHVIARVT